MPGRFDPEVADSPCDTQSNDKDAAPFLITVLSVVFVEMDNLGVRPWVGGGLYASNLCI